MYIKIRFNLFWVTVARRKRLIIRNASSQKQFRPSENGRGWGMRYKCQLYLLLEEPKVTIHILIRKLRWSGKAERLKNSQMPTERQNKWPAGKPANTWKDSMVNAIYMISEVGGRGRSAEKNGDEYFGRPRTKTGLYYHRRKKITRLARVQEHGATRERWVEEERSQIPGISQKQFQ